MTDVGWAQDTWADDWSGTDWESTRVRVGERSLPELSREELDRYRSLPSKAEKCAFWQDRQHAREMAPGGIFAPGGSGSSTFSYGATYTPTSAPVAISATPFQWIDPIKIPRRAWVYGRHFIRKFISATVAPGGVGKSSLTIVEALAIATGRPLLDVMPDEQTNVWLWNGEDPLEELQRRVIAAALHYGINEEDLAGRLYVDTGREMRIIIAEQTKAGAIIATPVVEAVKKTIVERGIGVVVIDPFVASHRVTENDNNAIEVVAAAWAEIADATGCAIELVHHSRKTGGVETTVEDARGASSLLAKARSARVINGMSQEEADQADVENRRLYFRCENGKANLTVPADKATWLHLKSVELGNSDPAAGYTFGDSVGVVTAWAWPEALDGVQVSHLREVQTIVAAGRYRASNQADAWVGKVVADVMRLDLAKKGVRTKIGSILKTWMTNRMFKEVEDQDPTTRKTVKFVEVDQRAD